jgi:hypothetical protein
MKGWVARTEGRRLLLPEVAVIIQTLYHLCWQLCWYAWIVGLRSIQTSYFQATVQNKYAVCVNRAPFLAFIRMHVPLYKPLNVRRIYMKSVLGVLCETISRANMRLTKSSLRQPYPSQGLEWFYHRTVRISQPLGEILHRRSPRHDP